MPPTITELEDKYFDPALGLTRYYGDVEVIPHVDGVAYFSAIADSLDLCQGPGDKIYITSFMFKGVFDLRARSRSATGPGINLGQRLVALAARGADVRLIHACPFYSTGLKGGAFDSDDLIFNMGVVAANEILIGRGGINGVAYSNIDDAHQLRRLGSGWPLAGRVLLDWGGSSPDSRHDKSVIVCSASARQARAFVAGIDILQERVSTPEHLGHLNVSANPDDSTDAWSWHDAGVELRGSAALGVLDNFITRWTETATLPPRLLWHDGGKRLFNGLIEPSAPARPTNVVHPQTPAGCSVRILRSYESVRAEVWKLTKPTTLIPWHTLPAAPILEILNVLTRAISRAERYIYIECQTLNAPNDLTADYYRHDDLFPSLSAACARGVRVILLCSEMSSPATLSNEIQVQILSRLTPAQQDNFCLYRVEGCRMHAKIIIIDDEFASIGSANMWDRSMRGLETELNVAYVHLGERNSMVADLRVRLWLEHLRVDSGNGNAANELRDLDAALGIFRSSWATTSISFAYPNSKLREIAA